MAQLQMEMIRCGKLLFERRLISGWGGNLSCRKNRNEFWITGQHSALGFLTARDLVRIKADGRPLRKDQRASSETPMHMAVYGGTDAQAIVHAHPPMVLAFSLSHDVFTPISYEEKYTVGEVRIVAQDTPTVTKPEMVVEALQYNPVVIIKGHGTVAIGKTLEEAFLFTDLLEEAVHCQFFREHTENPRLKSAEPTPERSPLSKMPQERFTLFTREHMEALVEAANGDSEFRAHGMEAALTTSLTLRIDENDSAWTVHYLNGEITELLPGEGGAFMISGKTQWWDAVFRGRLDPFLATQQGKLVLKRGELAELSRWYKPFQRAFALWRTIPIH